MNPVEKSVRHINKRLDDITTFVNSPGAKERLAHDSLNPLRKLVLQAITATPGLPHFLYSSRVVKPYAEQGYTVIGTGHNAVTVQDGPTRVRKFYPRTADLDDAEKQVLIQIWEDKQATTMAHLPNYTIGQTFEVVEHPLNTNKSVISASQPFVYSESALNVLYSMPDTQAVQSLMNDIQMMYENSSAQALPDIVGSNNLLVQTDTGSIKLIDPIALFSSDPEDATTFGKARSFLKKITARR